MPQYIIDLWLDGYDTEAEMEKACDEFIYEQLNFTASSVKVKRSDYATLRARMARLEEALKEILNNCNWEEVIYEHGYAYPGSGDNRIGIIAAHALAEEDA